jgi:hypothetical protein
LTDGLGKRQAGTIHVYSPDKILAGQRVHIIPELAFDPAIKYLLLDETIGVPQPDLSNRAWLPWYNHRDWDDFVANSNPLGYARTFDLWVGTTTYDNFSVGSWETAFTSYYNERGQLDVYSSDGREIFMSRRAHHAYRWFKGLRWGGNYCTYDFGPGWPPSWEASANSAANTWNVAGSNCSFILSAGSYNYLATEYRSDLPRIPAWTYIYCYTGTTQLAQTVTSLNIYLPWSTTGASGTNDVQNVVAHEFGHWLSLDDLYDCTHSEKTMHAYIDLNVGETKKRTLHNDDIKGIKYIYGPYP